MIETTAYKTQLTIQPKALPFWEKVSVSSISQIDINYLRRIYEQGAYSYNFFRVLWE